MEEIEIVVAGFEFTPVVTQCFGRLSLILVDLFGFLAVTLCMGPSNGRKDVSQFFNLPVAL